MSNIFEVLITLPFFCLFVFLYNGSLGLEIVRIVLISARVAFVSAFFFLDFRNLIVTAIYSLCHVSGS